MPSASAAYACDITYGTNNEFGFDYLRDNMKYRARGDGPARHIYAIVDEVDSILIDEARTPLIISGPLDDRSRFYNTIDAFLPKLDQGSTTTIDEKQRSVTLTEAGMEKIENLLRDAGQLKGDRRSTTSRTSPSCTTSTRRCAPTCCSARQGLHRPRRRSDHHRRVHRPHDAGPPLFGRPAPGARSQGRREVQPENQTLASITFQNYFRMYKKLAGMTGTARPKRTNSFDIYKLEVVEVPTNLPASAHRRGRRGLSHPGREVRGDPRRDQARHARMQPVLVGTTSIEKSEVLGEYLPTS
jgi:preprotein translocase subunit SecA